MILRKSCGVLQVRQLHEKLRQGAGAALPAGHARLPGLLGGHFRLLPGHQVVRADPRRGQGGPEEGRAAVVAGLQGSRALLLNAQRDAQVRGARRRWRRRQGCDFGWRFQSGAGAADRLVALRQLRHLPAGLRLSETLALFAVLVAAAALQVRHGGPRPPRAPVPVPLRSSL